MRRYNNPHKRWVNLLARRGLFMKIRCPHCKCGIDLIADANLDDVPCPSCGTHFSLLASIEETSPIFREVETLRHFRFLHMLGEGQFGRVWLAKDQQLDRLVAIKVPHRS